MKPLSPRQRRILAFLQAYIRERGYPPTFREIGQGCQISNVSVVNYNLNILENAGYIRRDRGLQRAIVVLRKE